MGTDRRGHTTTTSCEEYSNRDAVFKALTFNNTNIVSKDRRFKKRASVNYKHFALFCGKNYEEAQTIENFKIAT